MSVAETSAVLNKVLTVVLRSFPQYLRWARPWVPSGHEKELQSLETIVIEQDLFADKIYAAIDDAGGLPDKGDFPMEFTDTHDLSIDYLMRAAVAYGKQDVADLEAAVATPNLAPQAESLVSEALHLARRQLASLVALVHPNPVV